MIKKLPNVSIIVLSSNNNAITMVLDSIISQLDENDEVIVVDDHSCTEIVNRLNKYSTKNNVFLINSEKKGNRSHNRNLGVQLAKNEILIFVDGDMIMKSDAINIFKHAHKNQLDIAFIGQTHATRYSEIPLKLYSGIDNYNQLISTEEGMRFITESDFFADKRTNFFNDYSLKDYFWLLYYSGVCSVEKSAFVSTGGFDETFTHWGAEDVDFGYRISKLGKIGFLKDAHSVHIPHKRDIFSIENSNYYNLQRLFVKHQTWEWELLSAFRVDSNILKAMISLKKQLSMVEIEAIPNTQEINCVYINTISKESPNGCIEWNSEEKTEYYNCIGISLAMLPRKVEKVYINDNIFVYPNFLFCKILQQALSISDKVFIVHTKQTSRIMPLSKYAHIHTQSQMRTLYHSTDIMEYQFDIVKNNMIKVSTKLDLQRHFGLK